MGNCKLKTTLTDGRAVERVNGVGEIEPDYLRKQRPASVHCKASRPKQSGELHPKRQNRFQIDTKENRAQTIAS
jgi:hypothetical protein